MDATSKVCHVVAMPYPGRGHVNPMINLCKLLAAKKTDILITVVVTEEWLGFIGPDPKPDNIRFSTIPNVLPSELVRGANYPAFYDAVMTKMGAPFERLLDQIQPPVATIIADIELLWAVPAGGRRNIPVASLSTPSASFFHLLFRNRELNLLEHLMDHFNVDSTTVGHVAAMPFPGRGHINPMMNLCKLLASKNPQLLVTFIITEEWLSFIGFDPKPDNIRFSTIPNVIPAERLKATDFPGFYEAVMTKMEAPFELLLSQLDPPATAVIADIEVRWGVGVGIRRNIPVALLWTMPATFLSMLHRFNIFSQNKDIPLECFDSGAQIPGISSSDLADLGEVFRRTDPKVMKLALECISWVPKAQCLLFTSFHELEPEIFHSLQAEFPFPVYPIGPAIPYLELGKNSCVSVGDNGIDYMKWLDSQPKASVLYISLGSFLSVSNMQMDEITAGLKRSGVRFLWVARGEAARLSESCSGSDGMGLVVPWCEQLKVLCHSSVGGFWSHCGWNSTLEAVFASVPMLTFPLFLDQIPNSRQIVDGWKIGKRVKSEVHDERLMTREEVAELVKRFMDPESSDGIKMRRKAKELGDLCHRAIAKGGSSDTNLDDFIRDLGKATCNLQMETQVPHP
ncbi:UDP-glycosyltransferase 87A1-like [Pyrus communis]|uniref:UDP-glycosyltransferase 87A1-like n=1 Tax=Pyrus communis TaxID=23211 RepID=UPI0035C1A263